MITEVIWKWSNVSYKKIITYFCYIPDPQQFGGWGGEKNVLYSAVHLKRSLSALLLQFTKGKQSSAYNRPVGRTKPSSNERGGRSAGKHVNVLKRTVPFKDTRHAFYIKHLSHN